MHTADFLLEIGTYELPPKSLPQLATALEKNFKQLFETHQLVYQTSCHYYTPRRLTVYFHNLALKQADATIAHKGPPVSIAFQDQKPTLATCKFAETCGTTPEHLTTLTTPKGEFLFFEQFREGLTTQSLLPSLIEEAVRLLPPNKTMYWGKARGPFARPVKWLVALLDEQIIPVTLFGIPANRVTVGHPFLAPQKLTLTQPQDYLLALEKSYVLADPGRRKQAILTQIQQLTPQVVLDEALLEESNNLVEWPVVLEGSFDPSFLQLPPEVIVTSLKHHQKCFCKIDAEAKLQNQFVMVSNLVSPEPWLIIQGNEKVVRARLTDALYFFHNDQDQPLSEKLPLLKQATFQTGLGSLYDKVQRLIPLVASLDPTLDKTEIRLAAQLAKCDLLTEMVNEFPELQGTMGYYYTVQQYPTVALAIKEHYFPRFAEDQLPQSPLGINLALADRLDTLVGLFSQGKIPTGDKDPLGLRRIALAIIRIILNQNLSLNLKPLLLQSCELFQLKNQEELVHTILAFIYDRLQTLYLKQNKNPLIFKTLREQLPGDLLAFKQAYEALEQALYTQNLPWLTSYKRIINLLDKDPLHPSLVLPANLQTTTEKQLYQLILSLTPTLEQLLQRKNYPQYLTELNQLTGPLEDFFTTTTVLTEDLELRSNRLALLKQTLDLFERYGKFSYLLSKS